MNKKKLGVAAAVVVIGTAIGMIGLVGGTAHAQSAASISITGTAQAGTVGSPEPEVLVSVTCPAGDQAQASVTITQGGFYHGSTNLFTCSGSPQNETADTVAVSGTDGFIFAGPVSVGASLWIGAEPSDEVGTTATVTYP